MDSEHEDSEHGVDPPASDPPDDPAAAPGGGERADAELPSLPRRALMVFVSPAALFDRLGEEPVWLDVMVLVAALSLASTLLVPEELVREAMMQQAPEGTDAAEIDRMAGFVRTSGMVAAVVGPLFVAAVVAGASHLVFTLVLGGRGTYRKLFSAASHMMLVPTVGALLTVPLILATGDVQTTLALHLLAPGLETGSYPYRLLHGLNLFGIAGAAVMGLAVGRLYDRRSTGSAVAVMLGLYLVLKAAMAVFAGPAGPGAAGP